MSREEIVSAIQDCARKLGRVPTRRELQRMNGVSHREVDRRFGSYGRAVTLAGLEPERKHKYGIAREVLLEDWVRVARSLGKAPTRFEYVAEGGFSTTPFERHWKRWGQVGEDFLHFAQEPGQKGLWEDAVEMVKIAKAKKRTSEKISPLIHTDNTDQKGEEKILPLMNADATDRALAEITRIAGIEKQTLPLMSAENTDPRTAGIEEHLPPQIYADDMHQKSGNDGIAGLKDGAGRKSLTSWDCGLRRKRRVLRDRPVYGAPARNAGPLGHIPTTEAGVLVAFGMIAAELGLIVLRVQTEFPDCEVLCEMEPGRWQRLRVEFEFESRNFLRHHHDATGCDMIVCWTHNWPECPEWIEVVELSRLMREV